MQWLRRELIVSQTACAVALTFQISLLKNKAFLKNTQITIMAKGDILQVLIWSNYWGGHLLLCGHIIHTVSSWMWQNVTNWWFIVNKGGQLFKSCQQHSSMIKQRHQSLALRLSALIRIIFWYPLTAVQLCPQDLLWLSLSSSTVCVWAYLLFI